MNGLEALQQKIGVTPDILKLDIEGEEYKVVDHLELPKCLMVEFHGERESEYVTYLQGRYKEAFKSGHDYLFI